MAIVLKTARGYEIFELNRVGMRLVNQFQRQLPQLCEPSPEPRYRCVLRGTPTQNLVIEKLIADIRVYDPEEQLRTTRRRR